MKTKKLKGWVLPSLYACFFIGVFLVTVGVSNVLMEKSEKEEQTKPDDINYVSESIIDEDKSFKVFLSIIKSIIYSSPSN